MKLDLLLIVIHTYANANMCVLIMKNVVYKEFKITQPVVFKVEQIRRFPNSKIKITLDDRIVSLKLNFKNRLNSLCRNYFICDNIESVKFTDETKQKIRVNLNSNNIGDCRMNYIIIDTISKKIESHKQNKVNLADDFSVDISEFISISLKMNIVIRK